jgi:hypothetical protein
MSAGQRSSKTRRQTQERAVPSRRCPKGASQWLPVPITGGLGTRDDAGWLSRSSGRTPRVKEVALGGTGADPQVLGYLTRVWNWELMAPPRRVSSVESPQYRY